MADDPINPSHYKAGGIEAGDVVDAFDLGFWRGNALKYILRAGRKGGPEKYTENLAKAVWCLNREIQNKTKG